jgi:transposase InsO family protein
LLGGLRIERPNQVWCADITHLPMRKGFLHLVAIMDWFTRKVLAWRISNTLEAEFCVEVLNEAIHKFSPPEIMNTDQGSQFTSFDWTERLNRAKTKISTDGKARHLDNIFIERLSRSLKMNASTCTPGQPDRRQGPASDAGSPSTTTSGPLPPTAVNIPPWSTSTQPKPISRSRQSLKQSGKLPKDRGVAQGGGARTCRSASRGRSGHQGGDCGDHSELHHGRRARLTTPPEFGHTGSRGSASQARPGRENA